MLQLNKILDTGSWSKITKLINDNFAKIVQRFESGDDTSSKIRLFATTQDATKAYPSPKIGQVVLIGSKLPAPVYTWNGTQWKATGGEGGTVTVTMNDYYTKEQIDSRTVIIKATNEVNI